MDERRLALDEGAVCMRSYRGALGMVSTIVFAIYIRDALDDEERDGGGECMLLGGRGEGEIARGGDEARGDEPSSSATAFVVVVRPVAALESSAVTSELSAPVLLVSVASF